MQSHRTSRADVAHVTNVAQGRTRVTTVASVVLTVSSQFAQSTQSLTQASQVVRNVVTHPSVVLREWLNGQSSLRAR